MNMQHIKNLYTIIYRHSFWQLPVLFILDFAYFGTTNVSKISAFLMIIGFVFLMANVYFLIYKAIGLVRLYGLPVVRRTRLSMYLTGAIGLLVALQSIGELSLKDILVMLPLALIAYLYQSYMRTSQQKIL